MKKLILFISLFVSYTTIYSQVENDEIKNSATENISFNFCSTLEIHPNENDFVGSTNVGKIMISTIHDDTYHTTYQSQDGEVTIEVILDGALAGEEVFFKVVNPDLDDLSSYEVEMTGGDNGDLDIGSGKLNGMTGVVSAVAVLSLTDPSIAEAMVTLNITNQYAGDNYQVLASLDSNFELEVVETATLVAWKRIYVEVDRMLKKGSLTFSQFGDTNTGNDEVTVDDVSDFEINQMVEIFAPPSSLQTPIITKIISINTIENKLILEDMGDYIFPFFSGIKLINNDDVFEAGLGMLTDAHGMSANGVDGGTFTEFSFGFTGSGFIPKVKSFPDFTAVGDVVTFWRNPDCDPFAGGQQCLNYIQLAIVRAVDNPGSRGVSDNMQNFSVIFRDNIENDPNVASNNIESAVSEVVVHETGHQFDLNDGDFGIVDLDVSTPLNHESSDVDVMSYGRDVDDGQAEFSLMILMHIRALADGI